MERSRDKRHVLQRLHLLLSILPNNAIISSHQETNSRLDQSPVNLFNCGDTATYAPHHPLQTLRKASPLANRLASAVLTHLLHSQHN